MHAPNKPFHRASDQQASALHANPLSHRTTLIEDKRCNQWVVRVLQCS
jgi:hypothetical protein